jgi:serine O-acetyltransferase
VVKAVPDGATVVGVPGKLITPRKPEAGGHREEIAKKIGFDAYGATKDATDPVAHAINCMLDHMHVMDKKMQSMCEAMKRLGIDEDESLLPDLDSCEIISTAEELKKLDEETTGDEKTTE